MSGGGGRGIMRILQSLMGGLGDFYRDTAEILSPGQKIITDLLLQFIRAYPNDVCKPLTQNVEFFSCILKQASEEY